MERKFNLILSTHSKYISNQVQFEISSIPKSELSRNEDSVLVKEEED